MAPDRKFQSDIPPTAANFLQARAALDGAKQLVFLDFEMLEFEPPSTTMTIKCTLADVRKLVHTVDTCSAYFRRSITSSVDLFAERRRLVNGTSSWRDSEESLRMVCSS